MTTDETSGQHCLSQARDYDYDRYFAAAFADEERRRGLFALYAFNLEIAAVRERVSEPMIGLMRLQWWRDTVEAIYSGTVRSHAVAEEIARAVSRHELPREAFLRMIEAREFDLEDGPPEDVAALKSYAAATAGDLAGLAVAVCGAAGQADAARQAGEAWALAGLLRSVPFHASLGKVFVPADLLRAAGLGPDDVGRPEAREAVAAAVAPLAHAAAVALAGARRALRGLPRAARPGVAYLPVAGMYLGRLGRQGGDVFAPGLEPGLTARQLRIGAAAVAGKF